VTHYKVHTILCEGLLDGQRSFCGLDIATPGEKFHLIGAISEAEPYYERPKVDCPKCMRMYDAVINDYLTRVGN
jgi:hypothetical protein